jgi:hypothetical protein
MFGTTVKKAALAYFRFIGAQQLYVMGELSLNPLKPACWKIGGSGSLDDTRLSDIRASLKANGHDVELLQFIKMPVWNYPVVEKLCHRLFKRFNHNAYPNTSGWTEWFKGRNWGLGIVVLLWYLSLGFSMPVALLVGAALWSSSIPFDAIICVFLLGLAQLAMKSALFIVALLIICMIKFGVWPTLGVVFQIFS